MLDSQTLAHASIGCIFVAVTKRFSSNQPTGAVITHWQSEWRTIEQQPLHSFISKNSQNWAK